MRVIVESWNSDVPRFAEPIGMAIGRALSPLALPCRLSSRAERFWAQDVPGAKESMGSIADRISTGEVGDASEPGLATRSGCVHPVRYSQAG